jgi:D-alanine-D-alanine ligase
VSLAGEIIMKTRAFYDYQAKYLETDAAELVAPAELSDRELNQMQALARRAFDALGCTGLARTDFFLTDAGFVLTEVNTMPGFTPISMYPRLWQVSGLEYRDLITELIELGIERGLDR